MLPVKKVEMYISQCTAQNLYADSNHNFSFYRLLSFISCMNMKTLLVSPKLLLYSILPRKHADGRRKREAIFKYNGISSVALDYSRMANGVRHLRVAGRKVPRISKRLPMEEGGIVSIGSCEQEI